MQLEWFKSDWLTLLLEKLARKGMRLYYRGAAYVYQSSDSRSYIIASSEQEALKLVNEVQGDIVGRQYATVDHED